MKAELTLWILPTLGVLSLATAGILHFVLPRERLLGELTARCAELEQKAQELQAMAVPSQDEGADLLPLRSHLGEVIRVVEATARGAGIDGITMATGDDTTQHDAAPAAVTRVGDPAPGSGTGHGAETAGAAKVPEPKLLRCRIQARSGFMPVVRFLGMLEGGTPLMRVKALEILPTQDGVQASFVLESFWYPKPNSPAAAAAAPVR